MASITAARAVRHSHGPFRRRSRGDLQAGGGRESRRVSCRVRASGGAGRRGRRVIARPPRSRAWAVGAGLRCREEVAARASRPKAGATSPPDPHRRPYPAADRDADLESRASDDLAGAACGIESESRKRVTPRGWPWERQPRVARARGCPPARSLSVIVVPDTPPAVRINEPGRDTASPPAPKRWRRARRP